MTPLTQASDVDRRGGASLPERRYNRPHVHVLHARGARCAFSDNPVDGMRGRPAGAPCAQLEYAEFTQT